MNFFNLKKLLTKILQNIRRLPNYYNLNGGSGNRSTSANIDSDNSGSMIQFLSTSAMTTGKPDGDGNILHFNWDNSNKWASQLFIPHSSGGKIQFRTQSNGTTWDDWHDMYYNPIEIPANTNLNSYNAPCVRYCPGNTTVATLTNCPTSSAFFLYVEKRNRPNATTSDTYQYYTQTIKDIEGKVYIRKITYSNGTWNYGSWGNGLPYVANNLTTSSAGTYVLDAYQGKILNDKFGNYVKTSAIGTAASKSVANNLTTSSAGSYVLDAYQGKVLNDKFSSYLPKSGGTATGNITIEHSDTTQSLLRVQNSVANGYLYANASGGFGLYNATLGHNLITENSSGVVSIHGWTNYANVGYQSFSSDSYTYLANNASVRRFGRIAILTLSNLTGTTSATDYTLFTMNAEFKPTANTYQDCVVAGSTLTAVRITINTSGTVTAHTYNTRTATDTVNLRANIPYICAGT